jgi:hypothetical protein
MNREDFTTVWQMQMNDLVTGPLQKLLGVTTRVGKSLEGAQRNANALEAATGGVGKRVERLRAEYAKTEKAAKAALDPKVAAELGRKMEVLATAIGKVGAQSRKLNFNEELKAGRVTVDLLNDRLNRLTQLRDKAFDPNRIKTFNAEIQRTQKLMSAQQAQYGGAGGTGRGRGFAQDVITGQLYGAGLPGQLAAGALMRGGAMSRTALVAGGLAAGGIALGAGAYGATKKAMSFEYSLGEANATARLGRPELKVLGEELLKIGSQYGTDQNTLGAAFAQAVSAVGDPRKALEIVRYSAPMAMAGHTDIGSVVDMMGSMNAAGARQGLNPKMQADIIAAVQNKGRLTYGDVSRYLPGIIGMDNNRFGIQGAAAALSTLSTSLPKEKSANSLENVFTALGRTEVVYGTKNQKGLKGNGINVFNKDGSTVDIVNLIDQIATKLNGKTDQQKFSILDSMGFDAQASLGIKELVNNKDLLREHNDFIKKSSEGFGELNKSVEAAITTQDKWNIVGAKIDVIVTKIGNAFLPAAEKLADFLTTKGDARIDYGKQTGAISSNPLFAAVNPLATTWTRAFGKLAPGMAHLTDEDKLKLSNVLPGFGSKGYNGVVTPGISLPILSKDSANTSGADLGLPKKTTISSTGGRIVHMTANNTITVNMSNGGDRNEMQAFGEQVARVMVAAARDAEVTVSHY